MFQSVNPDKAQIGNLFNQVNSKAFLGLLRGAPQGMEKFKTVKHQEKKIIRKSQDQWGFFSNVILDVDTYMLP